MAFNSYANVASGKYSHAEGGTTTASGQYSHAEGSNATASNYASHAEGASTIASGQYSHAEGSNATASNYASHAEGASTIASNHASHAEGNYTVASGSSSHAEGGFTEASGHYSHAEGAYTKATRQSQNVIGEYNEYESENSTQRGEYVHIVGNGTSINARSNAHTLDWDGNAEYAGDVIANACGGENPISLVEVAERTKAIESLDLNNVIYYEEVTDENEEDVISALCFDQLSLSSDGTYIYLKFGNTVLSKVKVDGVSGSSENENLYITGVSFKAGGTWYSSSDTTEILYVSINGSRGCSQYNGEDVVIPIEASTTYTVDFSGIDNSNYIVGYAITNADGYRIVDSGWLSSQTATFTTPGDAHGLTLNFKYGSAGSTSITTEMAQALTDALTIKKEAA